MDLQEGSTVHLCFAVFPDNKEPRAGSKGAPLALFDTLEDAMDWGLERFPGGAFRLKYLTYVVLEGQQSEPRA
jgi:hypothetical protein